MKRDSEALKLRTKDFALRVLRLYRSLPRTRLNLCQFRTHRERG